MNGEFLLSVLSEHAQIRDQVLLIMRQSLPRLDLRKVGSSLDPAEVPFLDSEEQASKLAQLFKTVFKETDELIKQALGDIETRERLEFVQAQVLLLMSGLNFGKRQDEVLIEFWRDTNLCKYHIVNDPDLRKRGPQFKQALIHLVSNMIEAAAASSKKDNKKAKGLAADEEEKKEAGAAAEKI